MSARKPNMFNMDDIKDKIAMEKRKRTYDNIDLSDSEEYSSPTIDKESLDNNLFKKKSGSPTTLNKLVEERSLNDMQRKSSNYSEGFCMSPKLILDQRFFVNDGDEDIILNQPNEGSNSNLLNKSLSFTNQQEEGNKLSNVMRRLTFQGKDSSASKNLKVLQTNIEKQIGQNNIGSNSWFN